MLFFLCKCRYTHNVDNKPVDLRVPSVDEISEEPPFNVRTLDGASVTPRQNYPSLDMGVLFLQRRESEGRI